ncbi:MAG: polysaccharide deacetylase family protein [Planctomycetota bacterium]|jgi:peptidoglycan/xylan/chitin deacetylase (PgdA/CDA1 family)
MLLPPLITTAGLLAAWYALPHAAKTAQRRRLRARVTSEPTLCLTYDDGPSPAVTDPLLDLLAAHGARATFFALACHARRRGEILDRVRAAGHEIGVHGDRHANAWSRGPWANVREVTRGVETLEPWLDERPPFRPPFGKATLATWLAAARYRLPMAWWTHDGRDTASRLPPPATIVDAVRRSGGGVVLMHDCERSNERNAYVLSLSAMLLEEADRAGWRVACVGNVLRAMSAPAAVDAGASPGHVVR